MLTDYFDRLAVPMRVVQPVLKSYQAALEALKPDEKSQVGALPTQPSHFLAKVANRFSKQSQSASVALLLAGAAISGPGMALFLGFLSLSSTSVYGFKKHGQGKKNDRKYVDQALSNCLLNLGFFEAERRTLWTMLDKDQFDQDQLSSFSQGYILNEALTFHQAMGFLEDIVRDAQIEVSWKPRNIEPEPGAGEQIYVLNCAYNVFELMMLNELEGLLNEHCGGFNPEAPSNKTNFRQDELTIRARETYCRCALSLMAARDSFVSSQQVFRLLDGMGSGISAGLYNQLFFNGLYMAINGVLDRGQSADTFIDLSCLVACLSRVADKMRADSAFKENMSLINRRFVQARTCLGFASFRQFGLQVPGCEIEQMYHALREGDSIIETLKPKLEEANAPLATAMLVLAPFAQPDEVNASAPEHH